MKSDIRIRLREALGIPNLPNEDGEINKETIQNVRWQDIELLDGDSNGESTELTINVSNNSVGILGIKALGGQIYQPNIALSKNAQGGGLGFKVYQKFISEFGHLYSGKGRRMNPKMDNIWGKLKASGDYECLSNEIGDLCMVGGLDNADQLRQFMQ